ncbi:NAD-dependent epimerase/dehydratase family protein [Herbidospora galbida]|uniref:NAD-dependent epimerase/dehydratase family protein n=1 Tax=Herbidospora galbida TaxID=2575442 RepID=A0A4U3MLF2_9ACTN|nr:NAD-dependent epimerase/dehydratase family protein [Herbidospora galbida]TKK90355.1 NAD-dependent epimerase/dehydratase family protein [Herbidospora galbida]
MRALVTGGAGFIGSHLTDALLAQGATVTVLDTLTSGRRERLPEDVDLRQIDITDAPAVTAVIKELRPEVVFHLAAQIDVRASVVDPAHDSAVNIGGTITLLEAARTVDARLVFASTGGALYGMDAPIPSDERVPPAPEAPYGTAKYCAEQYLALFNRLYGTRHIALRLGNVYGPRQDPAGEAGVISIFCGRVHEGQEPIVYGDGTQTRDYVYVGDVVTAFLAADASDQGGTWNIGTGRETSVLDLIKHIGQAAGRETAPSFAPARLGELQRSTLDATAARNDLGWFPLLSITEGIDRVYAWIREGRSDRTTP